MYLLSLLRAARRLAASRPEARRFAVRAWLGAPLVQASLALVGLRPTLRWIEAVEPAFLAGRGAPRIGVAEGSALVSGAFRAHVVGGECLPQSLVQYLLHRRDGLPVRLVVGVRRADQDGGTAGHVASIAAHAWIDDGSATEDPAFAPLFVTGHVRSHPRERCAA
jgi:hypothetical protein